LTDMTQNDPSSLNCALFKGYGLNSATIECLSPSIVEDDPYVVDEGYLSDYHRFLTLLMSMPPMSGGEHELDMEVGIEFEVGPSNGANPRMIVFMDPKLWTYF